MNVHIRVAVQDDTVDEATATRFLQEFILDKFSYVDAVTPMTQDRQGYLHPERRRTLDREDRPVKAQTGEGN
jgi:hypothetical protein